MKNFILIGLFAMIASAARATDLCLMAQDLNTYLATETGYVPPPCPKIGLAVLPAGEGLHSQAGAYFPENGRIELAPDIDLTTEYGKSYLLHELVHAAQYANGAEKKAPCVATLEAKAYGVQARYLIKMGDREDALTLFLLGTQLGQCGGSYED